MLAGGGQGRKLARSRVPRSTVLSRVGRGLQWRRVGGCVVTVVQAEPTGPGSLAVLAVLAVLGSWFPSLRRKSRTAIIVDWAQQMRESDRPTDTPALHRTAPHPGTGHRANLKGLDILHSCYIRRGTSLSRSADSLVPIVGSFHHPSLPLSIRAAQCKLPPPLGCATQSTPFEATSQLLLRTSTAFSQGSPLTDFWIRTQPCRSSIEQKLPPTGALCLPQ